MLKSIKELFETNTGKISDKWSLYLNEYDNIFKQFQLNHINLLEIGVQNGGSLEIWAKYFNNAINIIGVDIDERCRNLNFEDNRISLVIGNSIDQTAQTEVLSMLAETDCSELDIIIDDGSHISQDIISNFLIWFPYLKPKGIYIIEDLHASYWKEFGGGLTNPYSAMSFLKKLCDVINFEHWREPITLEDFFIEINPNYKHNLENDLKYIHSIKFVNSLCIIKKDISDNNTLGKRIILGTQEEVTNNIKSFNQTLISDVYKYKKTENKFEELNSKIASLENELALKDTEIKNLSSELANKDSFIQELNSKIASLENELISVLLSRSWRYTRPIRKLLHKLKGSR